MKKLISCLILSSITSIYAANPVYIDLNGGVNTSWNALGLGFAAGYKFNRYFSLEGGLTYSPGYNYQWGGGTYSSNYWMLDAAAKGVLPLSNVFDLYAKLGIGFNNYTTSWSGCGGACNGPAYSGSNVGVLYGLGGAFHISRNWELHLEDYTTSGPNPNFLMFGAQYNF